MGEPLDLSRFLRDGQGEPVLVCPPLSIRATLKARRISGGGLPIMLSKSSGVISDRCKDLVSSSQAELAAEQTECSSSVSFTQRAKHHRHCQTCLQ